jgi:hypothetical protein
VWAEALRRFTTFRDGNDDARFFDVPFLAMQKDPLGAVEQLYVELGDALSAETRARMRAWWDASAADRKATPQQPERFGLDVETMRQQFTFYHDRFVSGPGDDPESGT